MQIEIEFDQSSLLSDPVLRNSTMQLRIQEHVGGALPALKPRFNAVRFSVGSGPTASFVCRVLASGDEAQAQLRVAGERPITALLAAVAELAGPCPGEAKTGAITAGTAA